MKTQATRFLYIIVLTQFLTACFLTDMMQPDRTLTERIADAKIILTAAYGSIGADVGSGMIDDIEGQKRFDLVKDTRDKVEKAENFILLGQIDSAEAKMKLVETSMVAIRKYISSKAAEGQ